MSTTLQSRKNILSLVTVCAALALVLIGFSSANAWHATGCFYCDDNSNGVIDDEGVDSRLPDVNVEISNEEMSFSDTRTTGSDGCFYMTLPDTPDSYTATVNEATLPDNPTFVNPSNPYAFTTSAWPNHINVQDWLIDSPACHEEELGTGRFTGGGHQLRVDGVRVTRGLTIHCDLLLSNNLEVNWQGNKFHMTEHLETVDCSDSPDIIQFPPDAPLDTLIGIGTGRYNGQDGFTIEFTLVDAGEPGREDMAALLIYETANPSNVVLNVPLQLMDGGNLQAHYDQPHK